MRAGWYEVMSVFATPPLGALSVAPMIQWTDAHWRYYVRAFTGSTTLYTEMTMANTLVHNPHQLYKFIGHSAEEHPLVLQLGGCEPEILAKACELVTQFGTWEGINLNCGCPSNKARKQGFGAEMMLDVDRTRRCVYAMKRVSSDTPITVKCRLGVIPGCTTYTELQHFVASMKAAGTSHIIVHARNCILRGLSPAQNRTIPPLQYHIVDDLRRDFPDMQFTLNGGVQSLEHAQDLLRQTHDPDSGTPPLRGIMIGRAAYHQPWMLARADSIFCAAENARDCRGCGYVREKDGRVDGARTRLTVLERYLEYCDRIQFDAEAAPRADGGGGDGDRSVHYNFTSLVKPLHNFASFLPNAEEKQYKQILNRLCESENRATSSEVVIAEGSGSEFVHQRKQKGSVRVVMEEALKAVPFERLHDVC